MVRLRLTLSPALTITDVGRECRYLRQDSNPHGAVRFDLDGGNCIVYIPLGVADVFNKSEIQV
jgi:hypothetical protein